jgi:hypothetical protein
VEVVPASPSVEFGIPNRRNGDSQEVTAVRKCHIPKQQALQEHDGPYIQSIENISPQHQEMIDDNLHTPGKVEMAGKEEIPGKAEAAEKVEVAGKAEVPGKVENEFGKEYHGI